MSRDPIGSCSATAFPNGESLADIGARAIELLAVCAVDGDVLVVFQRPYLCGFLRWCGRVLEAGAGRYFTLSTASLSILSYEHMKANPVLQLWNDVGHLPDS